MHSVFGYQNHPPTEDRNQIPILGPLRFGRQICVSKRDDANGGPVGAVGAGRGRELRRAAGAKKEKEREGGQTRARAPPGSGKKKEREGGRIRAPRQRQSAPSPHVVAIAMPYTAAWEREEESKAAAWEREDRIYFAFAVVNGRIWVAHLFTVP